MTLMAPIEIEATLTKLGCYSGPADGSLSTDATRAAIRLFQSDQGLQADGIYGPHTEACLLRYGEALANAPATFKQARRFRITQYILASEGDYGSSSVTVPLLAPDGSTIAAVSPAFAVNLALEGSGRTNVGTLVNTTGNFHPADPAVFQPQLDAAKRILPAHVGWAGIVVENDKVKAAMTYTKVPAEKIGGGYGIEHGVPLAPFKTLATDIGFFQGGDPRFMGKGGLIPLGTKVWIPTLVGLQLPDGTKHDGVCTANDSGSAILNQHVDMFSGTASMVRQHPFTGVGYLWFEGIEDRISADATRGL